MKYFIAIEIEVAYRHQEREREAVEAGRLAQARQAQPAHPRRERTRQVLAHLLLLAPSRPAPVDIDTSTVEASAP